MTDVEQIIHISTSKAQVYATIIALMITICTGAVAFVSNIVTLETEHREVLIRLNRIEIGLTANQLQIEAMNIDIIKLRCRVYYKDENIKC